MATWQPEWSANLHGAEATWTPRGRNGSQICTAPKPRGHLSVTTAHKFARRRSPVEGRVSHSVTKFHGAEAPWRGDDHDGTHLFTGPWRRVSQRPIVAAPWRWGLGAMQICTPQWIMKRHGTEAPWLCSGYNGSQICTAPRPHSFLVVKVRKNPLAF